MPTYTINYSNFKISDKNKNLIAKGITKIHKNVTGANSFFAQVIFYNNQKKSHFMGGKKVLGKQIFLQGLIRGGRTKKIKKKLIISLRNILEKKTKITRDNIWVYIIDLPPQQMIEYGEILPESGKEKIWFSSLSDKLKNKLKKIDS